MVRTEEKRWPHIITVGDIGLYFEHLRVSPHPTDPLFERAPKITVAHEVFTADG